MPFARELIRSPGFFALRFLIPVSTDHLIIRKEENNYEKEFEMCKTVFEIF